MQKWYEWLEQLKRKMRSKRWRRCIKTKVSQIIEGAEGSAGLMHKLTEPTAWRGGAQILKKEDEDAEVIRPL